MSNGFFNFFIFVYINEFGDGARANMDDKKN